MTASIVICTRNRCAALKQTLDCLTRLAVPDGLVAEILVVDNGSTDGTWAFLAEARCPIFKVTALRETAGGKSSALNKALAIARGEMILFLDDDVRPAANWLREITRLLAGRRFDGVAGSVRLPAHLKRPWMNQCHLTWLAATDYVHESSPETAVGANMAVSRAVLARVPAFDPELGPGRLGLWEDTLFWMQLKMSGYRLAAAVDAVVEHHFDPSRLSRAAFLARARSEARSSAYVAWHWNHENRRRGVQRVAEYTLRLKLKRLSRRRDWQRDEGVAQWEMDLVTAIEFERSYRRERDRPQAYEQYGALKRPASRTSAPVRY